MTRETQGRSYAAGLLRYDAERRRVWVCGQRLHHGLTGALLTAAGLALAACLTGFTGLDGLGAGLADFFTAAVLAAAGLAACFLAGFPFAPGFPGDFAAFLFKAVLLTTASLSYVPHEWGA